MPQAAAPRGRRVVCKRIRTFGRWTDINARREKGRSEARSAACASLPTYPSHPQTAAKVAGFSPIGVRVHCETDGAGGSGFEPSSPPKGRQRISDEGEPAGVAVGTALRRP